MQIPGRKTELPIQTFRKAKGLILVYSGQISHKEMLDVRATFGNDLPEMEKCRFLLVDLKDAALEQISTDTLKELAGLHNVLAEHTFTGMPVAVVAPRDVEYGLSRMWQVFVEETGWETMVFRSHTEAQRWLQQRLIETYGNDTCRLKLNETPCESRRATEWNESECQA
jgi:hypothetical protein